MLKRVNFVWRLMGTALSFTLFGVGGVCIALFVSLLIALRIVPKERAALQARRFISRSFRLYINFMQFIGLLSYEVHGREKLVAPGCKLVIANHPSLLDVVFLIALIPQANCVVKSALWRNLFTRPPVRMANYISNESKTLVEEGVQALAAGETLMVFPEGTRTVPGEPFSFYRGFANIALLAQAPLTPVFISCTPQTLLKKTNWYNIPPEPPHFVIRVLDPIRIDHLLGNGESQSRNARALTAQVEAFYEGLIRASRQAPAGAGIPGQKA